MKSSNRVLIGFGIAIAVLVLVTVGMVLFRGGESPPPLPENTPEGTVQRYLLALKDNDYAAAQSYLVPPPTATPPGYPPFRPESNRTGWKATLGTARITGDNANVEVILDVFRGPRGPFDNPVQTNRINFSLKRQGGKWLITNPLAYWLY